MVADPIFNKFLFRLNIHVFFTLLYIRVKYKEFLECIYGHLFGYIFRQQDEEDCSVGSSINNQFYQNGKNPERQKDCRSTKTLSNTRKWEESTYS